MSFNPCSSPKLLTQTPVLCGMNCQLDLSSLRKRRRITWMPQTFSFSLPYRSWLNGIFISAVQPLLLIAVFANQIGFQLASQLLPLLLINSSPLTPDTEVEKENPVRRS